MALPGWESTAGVKSKSAKLNEDQVREIRRSTEPIAKLAARFKMHPQSIMNVKTKKTYWSVPDLEPVPND